MLKDMSNPSFLEITTIAHELLDYERISLRLRKNGSCRSLNELLRQVAFDIQDSKDETFEHQLVQYRHLRRRCALLRTESRKDIRCSFAPLRVLFRKVE